MKIRSLFLQLRIFLALRWSLPSWFWASRGQQRNACQQRSCPAHCSLALTPDLKAATFSGVESIDVNLLKPAQAITLNAIEIAFQSVAIESRGATQTGS